MPLAKQKKTLSRQETPNSVWGNGRMMDNIDDDDDDDGDGDGDGDDVEEDEDEDEGMMVRKTRWRRMKLRVML